MKLNIYLKKLTQTASKVSLCAALAISGLSTAQTTYTFTNAGATARFGPTQTQINTAYLSTNLSGSVQVTVQGIQTFTVPTTGLYKIEAWGACAGNARTNIDGLGNKLSAEVTFTAGQVISVVVGQKGLVTTQGGTNWKSGGGGASWVYSGTTPYLIAGGGGGAGENSTRSNATFTANFNSGYTYWGTTQKQINANAGTGGQAGTLTGGLLYATGAGGGGWNSDGTESTVNRQGLYNNRGRGRPGLFIGGEASNFGADGGFGGGAAGVDNTGAGGGGGGYTGGPGGEGYLSTPMSTWGSGGGGASYWAPFATNVTNLGTNGDHGKVIITQLFSAAITQTASILCNGLSTAALTSNVTGGLAPYTYTWLPTGGNASSATGLSAGVYTLTVKDANNFLTTNVYTVTQPSALNATTTQTNNTCFGSNNAVASVTATGGTGSYTYTWSPSGGTTSIATGLSAGGYTVNVKDANNCSYTTTISITQPLPVVVTATANNAAVCEGGTVTLTAGGANTYTWTGGVTNGVSFTPSVTSSYTVIGTNTVSGCTGTTAISVTVNPTPTITVNSGAICAGQSFTLTPGGASTYTISGGNAVVSPTATSSYSVTGTSSSGCVSANAAVSTVTVNALPTLTFTAAKDTACLNEANVTLNGLPSGGVYSGTNVSGNAFAPTTLGAFTLSYSYTNTATGCSNSTTFNVLVDPCTGVVELNSTLGVSVFPNPSSDIVNIAVSQGEIEAITLYDMTGRVIFTQSVASEKAILDLSDLASGLYYVNVVSGSKSGLIKVVKN